MEVCLLSHEVMLQPLSIPITGSAFAFPSFFYPHFIKSPYGFRPIARRNTGLPRSAYSTVWVRSHFSAGSFVSMYSHYTGE